MMAKRKSAAIPEAAIVEASIRAKTKTRSKHAEVEGFGCPRTDWPHHVQVVIPEVRGGDVQIVEDFGVGGHSAGQQEQAVRCVLPRARWTAIADVARREFNERLRSHGLPVGSWRSGITKVERMLGQELILLACVCGVADETDLPAITASWAALRPEERWWFAGWIVSRSSPRIMRGAALLLSGGPVETREPKLSAPRAQSSLPLFDTPPAGKC